MKSNAELEKVADRIADAIVDLVEHNDGPVSLVQVERQIPGFATQDSPAWCYTVGENDQFMVWEGMTKAGSLALGRVISGGRVAIQPVSAVLYLAEGRVWCPTTDAEPQWMPIVLLPARAANVHAGNKGRWRLSNRLLDGFKRKLDAEGVSYRPLTPAPLRYTADDFSP
jgi:hypothetical protein